MDTLIMIATEWWEVLAAVIAVASLIANKTKTDADNKAVGILSKLVNLLALNSDKLKK